MELFNKKKASEEERQSLTKQLHEEEKHLEADHRPC